jgi:hypothetical protein
MTSPPTFLYAECGGATALVHAYLATAGDALRLLSLGGPTEAVHAILATLLQPGAKDPITLVGRADTDMPSRRSRQKISVLSAERIPARRIVRRLPCGQTHGLYVADSRPAATPHRFSLLLPAAQVDDAPARLLRAIDARTPVPLRSSWAPWLWHHLEAEEALIPFHGEGPWRGWDVSYDAERLATALTAALMQGALPIAGEVPSMRAPEPIPARGPQSSPGLTSRAAASPGTPVSAPVPPQRPVADPCAGPMVVS